MLPKKGSYDKKIFRLVYILNKLDTENKVLTSKLAIEFNVSPRTVQRDLELLNMTGFPLCSSEKGCNSFAEDFSLKKILLSKEEASLLSFLYDTAKPLGKNFIDSFNDILRKVLLKATEPHFYVKIPLGTKLNGEFTFVKDLEAAIDACNKVNIKYETGGKEKCAKVHPLKIIFFDGFWYLLARLDGKTGIRKYRLENIKKVEPLKERFTIYKNLKTMLNESVNVWFCGKRDKKVVLKIDGSVAGFFRERTYFPLQKIAKENKDGSIIVESKVGQYMEVLPTIKAWMPTIKVLEPKELKEKLKEHVYDYAKAL